MVKGDVRELSGGYELAKQWRYSEIALFPRNDTV